MDSPTPPSPKTPSSTSSAPNSRPQTLRSRTGSMAGLDNQQLHGIINKKNLGGKVRTENNNGSSSPSSSSAANGSIFSENEAATTRSVSAVSTWSSVVSPSMDVVEGTSVVPAPRIIHVAPAKDTISICSSEATDSPRHKDDENGVRDLPTRVLYIDEIVWKIDDVLFSAAIDASTNMSLLCRLNIEFVCEITDENSESPPTRTSRGFDCPCLCPKQLNHFRYFLAMDVPETEQRCIDLQSKINMNAMFKQFNELVERGRKAGKCVLVCSTKGRNRAPTFCSAYLMARERISRCRAVAQVTRQMHSMRPPVHISDFMQRTLMRYQTALGVEPDSAYDSAHSIPLFHVKRTAWT